MKKWICWMLAAVVALSCAACFAEGTEAAKDTGFLQIKEGVTALIYANPGDEAAVDQLASGRLCGLLEETSEAGALWYFVFYLNSEKQGAVGYMKADDAVRLDEAALKALMENPDKMNEVLDLIDAMNAYLKSGEGTTGSGKTTGGLSKLYDEAMSALSGLFSAELSAELEKTAASAKDEANELVKTLGKASEADLDKKLDELMDTISASETSVNEALGTNAAEKINDLLTAIKGSENFRNVADTVQSYMKDISESGLDAVEQLMDLLK